MAYQPLIPREDNPEAMVPLTPLTDQKPDKMAEYKPDPDEESDTLDSGDNRPRTISAAGVWTFIGLPFVFCEAFFIVFAIYLHHIGMYTTAAYAIAGAVGTFTGSVTLVIWCLCQVVPEEQGHNFLAAAFCPCCLLNFMDEEKYTLSLCVTRSNLSASRALWVIVYTYLFMLATTVALTAFVPIWATPFKGDAPTPPPPPCINCTFGARPLG
jgi:hypothetical protein